MNRSVVVVGNAGEEGTEAGGGGFSGEGMVGGEFWSWLVIVVVAVVSDRVGEILSECVDVGAGAGVPRA